MPEKTQATRAKQAKKKGTPMVVKATDAGAAYGASTRQAKKSGRTPLPTADFADRSVSPRSAPGTGLTARSKKLPLPEGGSSTSRKKTLPTAAAAAYRKDGTAKRTTGRGDAPALKAGKAYASKATRNRQARRKQT
jgi:hypothetical protein